MRVSQEEYHAKTDRDASMSQGIPKISTVSRAKRYGTYSQCPQKKPSLGLPRMHEVLGSISSSTKEKKCQGGTNPEDTLISDFQTPAL
jgi:hypothetical protein